MKLDNETWLIEIGDEIIEKKSDSGYETLNEVEKSIYCFWVVDYAVRNSGTLDAVEDLYPQALTELNDHANSNGWSEMSVLIANSSDSAMFCDLYYEKFEMACNEVRSSYEST